MTCGYCGSRIEEGEHRCRRCGRRPGDGLAVHGALAAQLRPAEAPSEDVDRPATPPPDMGRAVQRQLFHNSNVIPFETYAPNRAEPPRKPSNRVRRAARQEQEDEQQGKLDFYPPQPPKARILPTTVEAVIVSDLPPAELSHRAVAAAIDWTLVGVGFGLFMAAYKLAGGEFELTTAAVLCFAGSLLLLGFVYHLICAVLDRDTPGMHWTHLHLVTFEGFEPEVHERVMRCVGAAVTVCSVLGLLWPLFEEERLGWRDHFSRSFASPVEQEHYRQG